jgi:hypothetical protein
MTNFSNTDFEYSQERIRVSFFVEFLMRFSQSLKLFLFLEDHINIKKKPHTGTSFILLLLVMRFAHSFHYKAHDEYKQDSTN